MSISWGGPYSPQRKWSLTFKVKFTTKRNELTMTKLPSQGGKILQNKNYKKKKKKKEHNKMHCNDALIFD